jgi:hypothetical protein
MNTINNGSWKEGMDIRADKGNRHDDRKDNDVIVAVPYCPDAIYLEEWYGASIQCMMLG